MGLFQILADFFKTIFSPSSPESIQRQAVRKIESELRTLAPGLYKSGLVQPEFAEALRVLFKNTSPITDILAETLCSTDLETSRHFEEQLIFTGFDTEAREILESLDYENRKKGAMEAQSAIRYFESEHRQLEKVIKELNSPSFVKIEETLNKTRQLNDICRFSYITALRLFDQGFNTKEPYVPEFQPVPVEILENSMLDLYFVISGMDITNSLYNAVLALLRLKSGGSVPEKTEKEIKENFKKIQYIVKHIFTKEILSCMIRIAKKNYEFVPEHAVYNGNSRQKYAEYLESRFRTDEARLKGELQDAAINSEIKQIFGSSLLAPVQGYSKDLDLQLRQSTPFSFIWITPLQLLKNFISIFYEDHVKPLLNDIVIEGFFNNPAYKTEFSSCVFTCNESLERIAAFESKFTRGNEFDETNITSLIRDSHKDTSFESLLKGLVDKINRQAKDLIQIETTNIFQLYKKINDIIIESKKPSSEVITNLKVLMISSRNRDNSDCMESQNGQWKVFLEIMKNYVIIGNLEKK
ncbi:DUF5312 family protein [Treponema sp.]|uniref:DUF5312 family protein n=1 Tax=Treponema sp. TaxID=166 RepID=UPI003F1060F3